MKEQNINPGGDTTSVWQGTFEMPTYPGLDRDMRADVCVVGAGIAGLSTAYLLAKSGTRVIVVDDGPVGGGESGRGPLWHVDRTGGTARRLTRHAVSLDAIAQG